MTRRDRERARLGVAQALLNAGRPLILADSPLLDETAVGRKARERYPGSLLGDELALGDLVREAAELVLRRLGDDPRLARERGLLATVLAGGSVNGAAAALGVSRAHLSNSSWRTVTGWVLDAFEELCKVQPDPRSAPVRLASET
jgi:hypothetical protein